MKETPIARRVEDWRRLWLRVGAICLLAGSLTLLLAGCPTKDADIDPAAEANSAAGGVGGLSEDDYAAGMGAVQEGQTPPPTGEQTPPPTSGE